MSYADIFEKCETDGGYFGEFRKSGDRYFTMPVLSSAPGTVMRFGEKDCIMWSINNYLGLAENEEIKRAALEAVETWGVSAPMGSRMMSGNTEDHIALEKELADFAGKEAAVLFNYGYLGVLGTITSIVDREDVIVLDKLDHASIVDAAFGAVSDRKNIRVYRHNDMDSLERTLKQVNETRKKGVIILTEGVFGMTGDLAKLDGMAALKNRYEARLFVDDAHGVGVMGKTGRGTAEYYGVQDEVDIYFGTFAKAFASIGGFSASKASVTEWIRYNARTQVFAKSLPMVFVKSLKKTLDLVRNGSARREKLFRISALLSEGLRNLGFYVGKVKSPIVPVFVPGADPKTAMEWISYLRQKGIFVTGVTYPVVPKNYIMFRMIPTASHDESEVESTIDAFKDLRDDRKLNLDVDWSDAAKLYRGA